MVLCNLTPIVLSAVLSCGHFQRHRLYIDIVANYIPSFLLNLQNYLESSAGWKPVLGTDALESTTAGASGLFVCVYE